MNPVPAAPSRPRVLLTSVCRPLGPRYGDSPSVGYELLYGQVTRAQGVFSPRALHLHFSLEYIAENLEAPTVVLQYPSKRELIRELKKGYEYVGVSFLLAVFHKMKDVVALIRKHSPGSKIILGGYGTVLSDAELAPWSDHICREEGVAWFRNLLGEPPLAMPYRHPMIVSKLKVLSRPAGRTGMVFAGLGCPNGCDFCCTSHFFSRKHIRLLPTGKDIYDVIQRYLDVDPDMSFTILDEDFVLNKRRAMEFRDEVLKGGRPLSIFAFSSIRALSHYRVEELLEMGIDGFWIGYEGTRSNFPKQSGRPAGEVLREFRENGIVVLASMIVGFDYQDEAIVAEELNGLLEAKPALAQFLIYGPTPGTPFYERIMKDGLLQDHLAKDRDTYYRKSDGFTTMIKHPNLSPEKIEALQRGCFEEDFRRLGPSIFRVLETEFIGYLKHRNSANPYIRLKAERWARDVRLGYPVFPVGITGAPSPDVKAHLTGLWADIRATLGEPTARERAESVAAYGFAAWTWLQLRMNWFQHPALTRTAYRMPETGWRRFHLWEELSTAVSADGLSVRAELQHTTQQVWLRVEGMLARAHADHLGARLRHALEETQARLVLDLKGLKWKEEAVLESLRARLATVRDRIRLILPSGAVPTPALVRLSRDFEAYQP